MEDRVYYQELECYVKAEETLIREIGQSDHYDLSLLRTDVMKEEFRRYIQYRGTQVSLNTMKHERTYFRQLCQAFQKRRNLPESLMDWEEKDGYSC